MGKKKLLKQIEDLKSDLAQCEEDYKLKHDEVSSLEKSLISVKNEVNLLRLKIKEMSNVEALYNEISHYRGIKSDVLFTHNLALDALYKMEAKYHAMIEEFSPFIKDYKQAVLVMTNSIKEVTGIKEAS